MNIQRTVLAACLALTACSDSPDPAGPADTSHHEILTDTPAEDDAAGSDTASDVALQPEQGLETDEGPGPVVVAGREVIAATTSRTCVGCDSVTWCGFPPMSDSTALLLDVAPNNDTGLLFATERWEAWARSLAPESCARLTGDALDAVVVPPHGVDVLDAGEVSLSGDMPLLSEPMSLDFKAVTHNYPSAARLMDVADYTSGAQITLAAAGGQDVSAFDASSVSVGITDILTPHTDGAGKIADIATDAPLEVTWSPSGEFGQALILLAGEYCVSGWAFMIGCRATDDGAFTVPAELLDGLEWPNIVELYLFRSRKIALEAQGLSGDPVWSVRSAASVPIYHDPQAAPVQFECTNTLMEPGYVGSACSDESECGGGCCVPHFADVYFFGGYCSLIGCSADADCPSDATCATNHHPQVPFERYCAKLCASDDDCRPPEYACLPDDSGASVCRPNSW